MNLQDKLKDATEHGELWAQLMPDQLPDAAQFLLWSCRYKQAIVQKGVVRAAGKRQKIGAMTLDELIRYAASVMKNESLGKLSHPSGYIAPTRPSRSLATSS